MLREDRDRKPRCHWYERYDEPGICRKRHVDSEPKRRNHRDRQDFWSEASPHPDRDQTGDKQGAQARARSEPHTTSSSPSGR